MPSDATHVTIADILTHHSASFAGIRNGCFLDLHRWGL